MRWVVLLIAPVFALDMTTAGRASEPKPSGLDRRIPWNDSRVVGSPDPLSPYKTVRCFPNLKLQQPLMMYPEPGTNRLFILHHFGHWSGATRILAMRDDQNESHTEVLLEMKALAPGLAFHPDYERNGYIYVGLNGPDGGWGNKKSQVVRYTVKPGAAKIDPKSAKVIIAWPSNGHDGIDVAFGNDGFLYVSTGDGSSGSDANLTGQSLDDLLAAILRIDVDHPEGGKPYSVPKDNPFVNRAGALPEIWAYGLRNPWRLSYDRQSDQLWVGQNGQDLWEQVYLVKKGANYGWSIVEGSHMFMADRKAGPDPIQPPTAEHSHSEARSITGGQVYRGSRLPDLQGTYLYGDWSTGKVWGIKHDGTKVIQHRELVDTPFNITGFGTDHANELYVIDHNGGFYRLEPTTEADRPTQPFPRKLSETGLFTNVASHQPNPAALPFDVSAPQWADGASMVRFAALTGMEKIVQQPQLNAGGEWSLPNGSVLVQTLSLPLATGPGKSETKRVETRLLVRQQDEWTGYSYRWNDEQTDAELMPAAGAGEVYEVADPTQAGGQREQAWRFPSRAECMTCHSRAAGFMLGFTSRQLNRDHDYGGRVANQLSTFEHIGLFEGALPRDKYKAARLVDPYDANASREARVRSYLHVNCSPCHVSEGGGNSNMVLDLDTRESRMKLVGVAPEHDRFNIADAQLVAPGVPERSVLVHRLSIRGTGQMPPLVSTEVDRKSIELISEWIRGLTTEGKSGH